MEKLTDKGLVVGLIVDEPTLERKAPKDEKVAETPVAASDEDEIPAVEAEVVDPAEAPRKSRGRPRKYID